MLLESIFTLMAIFKPVHVMDTPEVSCGATSRLLKETVKIEKYTDERKPTSKVRVNRMMWEILPPREGDWLLGNDDGFDGWRAEYRVRSDAYMSLLLEFTNSDAYLSIEGIDSKRRPCRDMIYLKRVR